MRSRRDAAVFAVVAAEAFHSALPHGQHGLSDRAHIFQIAGRSVQQEREFRTLCRQQAQVGRAHFLGCGADTQLLR